MGSRFRSALFASAILLIHSGIAGVSPAQETGKLDRVLARSLPDVSRWLSQVQSRFAVKPTLTPARDASVVHADDAVRVSRRDSMWLAVGLTHAAQGSDLVTRRNFTTIPLDLTVPATIDLSLDQFSDSTQQSAQHLRFADVGAVLSIPLASGPGRFGRFVFSAGAHLRLFDFELRSGNSGAAAQWIGCAGFSLSF
jgi:hypothetical protein